MAWRGAPVCNLFSRYVTEKRWGPGKPGRPPQQHPRKLRAAPPCIHPSVEQEGIEPSSKREDHTLSTRLVPLRLSGSGEAGTTDRCLILERTSAGTTRPAQPISDLPAPPYPRTSEKEFRGDVTSLRLALRLSQMNYYSSFRQREHSCCCQLNFSEAVF